MRYKDIYSIEIRDLHGKLMDLSDYKGKWLLIVNIAEKCGLAPQLKGLQQLYERFKDRGLVVIGCPSNQFLGQAPSSAAHTQEQCRRNYGAMFPITQKLVVNGKYSHPLFRYLKEELSGVAGPWLKWNFTKFLIDRMGRPFKRYGPLASPSAIAAELEYLLQQEEGNSVCS